MQRSRFFSTLASLVVGLGSFASLLAAPAEARADGTKVLVLPYAPLYESIPRATGDRIATILEEGLSGAGTVQVVPVPREGERVAKQASPEQTQAIAEATASVERGKELFQRRRVGPALQAFNRAIEQIEANVIALEEIDTLLEAYLQQAATLFLMGREDEAAAGPMEKALLIKPDLVLPVGETYGQPFVELLDKVRADIATRGTGSLRVDTTPPGALVWVDGREAPMSPVRITGLVPGVHYVKIKLPADPPYTEKVVIQKDALFHITPDEGTGAGGPVERIVGQLVQNRLEDDTKKRIHELAGLTGADVVVFGGVYAAGAEIHVVSYAYGVQGGGVTRLQTLVLDRDMLGATIEINKLATEVAQKSLPVEDGVTFPAPVAANAQAGAEVINEADFSINFAALRDSPRQGGSRPAVGPTPAGGSRRPVSGPRRPVGAGQAPEAAAPMPIEEVEEPVAQEPTPAPVDEFADLRFRDDVEEEKAPEPAQPAYTFSGGVSIEDQVAFGEPSTATPAVRRESGIFGKWWFWTAAAVVVGGTVGGIMAATASDDATPQVVFR